MDTIVIGVTVIILLLCLWVVIEAGFDCQDAGYSRASAYEIDGQWQVYCVGIDGDHFKVKLLNEIRNKGE